MSSRGTRRSPTPLRDRLARVGTEVYNSSSADRHEASAGTASEGGFRLASFGEELRQQRELREITLEEIAESTKVNRRFLEALERDDFDALPGGLFTRGFIRAYAAHVGLDPDAMVTAYLYQVEREKHEHGARRQRSSSAPRLEQERSAPAAGPAWLRDTRVRWGAAVVLVVLLVWLLFG